FLISAHTTKPIPPPPTVRIDPRPRNRGLESPWNTNFSAGAGDLKQASKKRKARGQNVLVDLEERRAKSSVPLPLEVDVVSSKIVGKESITFPRLIGREVRLHVPGWYHSWASVPQQHQDLVLSRVKRNVGYIETWKEAHINKKTKTFVNENARRDYERLKAAYEKRASIPNSGPVDEIAILREVLGERRGHNRGVGRKLKGQSSTHRTQPVPTQQMPMDPRVERELARLRRKIQHMSQKLAPEDRLPSDDEIVDMGATHPIGPSQTHMSVDGSTYGYSISAVTTNSSSLHVSFHVWTTVAAASCQFPWIIVIFSTDVTIYLANDTDVADANDTNDDANATDVANDAD
ncbi:hypothetical protein G4B88_022762, partial [Cannabis sativa]